VKKLLTRRQVIEIAAGGVALASLGGILAACDAPKPPAAPKETPKPGAEKPKAHPCEDVSALSEADKKGREGLKYTTKSEKPNQNCINCNFFKSGGSCGTCTLVKGPIAAEGWCSAWVKKPT
jgi:hypothetical protein